MLAEERHSLIQQHLRATGSVRTPELSRLFGVSVMTVWRDLEALERSGALQRVHGGAVMRRDAAEPRFAAKVVLAAEAKRTLAGHFAARHLRDGLTVAIEGGTTAVAVMPHFKPDAGITLLTNSLEVMRQTPDGVAVQCSGGMLRSVSQTLVGPHAVEFFKHHRADLAVISATGVDLTDGLMDPNPLEVEVKRALCRCARRIILLIDASKWGRDSVTSLMPLADVDLVITDAPPPPEFRPVLRKAGVELEVAGRNDSAGATKRSR